MAIPLLPPSEHITLIGINEARSPAPLPRFWKGAVSQPSINCSLSDPNTRGNVSRVDSLLMKFNHLLVSIQLLRSSPFLRSSDAGRASRTLFFLLHGLRLFWLLFRRRLYLQATSYLGPAASEHPFAHSLIS